MQRGVNMQLSKIKIRNYRLLIDAELEVDPKTTLIVGRNNTAKTSCFECICKVLGGVPFSFNDYPLSKRENLYANISSFMAKEITFEDLCERLEPISLEFLVDYSLDDPEENLGALSPFIIDVDVDTTTALIRAEYKLKTDENSIWKILEPDYYNNGSFSPADDVHNAIISNFYKLFEIVIYAINPKKPEEKQRKKQKELAELFPFHIIQAERRLGEDGTQDNSLSSLISDFFDMSEDELDPSVAEKVKELRAIVENANKNVQQQSDSILSALVSNAIGFGYPNGEELQLGVTTQLSELQKLVDGLTDDNAEEQMKIIDSKLESANKELDALTKMRQEVFKMKRGSIALVNQITTISKIRIYDPKTDHDVLSGIKLSVSA